MNTQTKIEILFILAIFHLFIFSFSTVTKRDVLYTVYCTVLNAVSCFFISLYSGKNRDPVYIPLLCLVIYLFFSTVEEVAPPVGVDPKSSGKGKGSGQAAGAGPQAPPEDPAAHVYKVYLVIVRCFHHLVCAAVQIRSPFWWLCCACTRYIWS